ncbi:MAG: hypothetical protein OXB84_06055, partial [Halobacteriovoraceae bacterium]|nr:hypothetical protein [Halobacteriovoraceae bacterium]
EEDGTERAICRFVRNYQIHLGKLIGDICYSAVNTVDIEKSKLSRSIFRARFTLVDSSMDDPYVQVLVSTNESDFYWQSFGEMDSNSIPFYAAKEYGEAHYLLFQEYLIKENAYICRAINKTHSDGTTRQRGIHSGQLHGSFDNLKCYYEYGNAGFRAPDYYTEDFEILMLGEETQ